MKDILTADLRACPLCALPSVSDILGSHYYRCKGCGIVYNAAHRSLDYGDGYFTTDYTAQYGKSYQEDFPSIYAQSVRRVMRAKKLLKRHAEMSALDVGAAMGFFLKAARDQGFVKTEGVELSTYASEISHNTMGISLYNSSFDLFNHAGQFSLVSAWYFLEHMADTLSVLKKLASMVKPAGVLAFSVPSWNGPAFKYNTESWIKTHPADHRIDFSPHGARKILRTLGFTKIEIYPAGIHPERMLPENSLIYPVFAPAYRIASELTAFSDTIEVYARKS